MWRFATDSRRSERGIAESFTSSMQTRDAAQPKRLYLPNLLLRQAHDRVDPQIDKSYSLTVPSLPALSPVEGPGANPMSLLFMPCRRALSEDRVTSSVR